MIPLVLAAALLPLGELPPQPLPKGSGCAVFLWTRSDPPLRIAMLSERTGRLKLVLGRREVELPRLEGPDTYGNRTVRVTLDLSLDAATPLGAGAFVGGVMRVERAGEDELALAVGGLRACV